MERFKKDALVRELKVYRERLNQAQSRTEQVLSKNNNYEQAVSMISRLWLQVSVNLSMCMRP